jgi:hypothetical protein
MPPAAEKEKRGAVHRASPLKDSSHLSIKSRFGPAYEDGERIRLHLSNKRRCAAHFRDLEALHEYACMELNIPPRDTLAATIMRARSYERMSVCGSPGAMCANDMVPHETGHRKPLRSSGYSAR